MEISYAAPDSVRDVIASMGRTEDVRFSPSGGRLAVAAFNLKAVVVFDIDIARSASGRAVALTRAVKFLSPSLTYAHGLDFIDDDTIVVASRGGDIPIFKLPSGELAGDSYELSPVQMLRASELPMLMTPGSVSAFANGRDSHEILVCNSYAHRVTRHRLDWSQGCSLTSSEILLEKWLDIPDGVSVSGDRQWLAVSNHNAHNVLLYRDPQSLNPGSAPDGVLRSVLYPHGVRFSADGRHIIVADAGTPYVHVYANDGAGWQGVRNPVASVRVMDQSVYLRGRNNPQEGGPKGIDIDAGMNVLVTTCECQPLAFFDLPAILERASSASDVGAADPEARRAQQALDVRHELELFDLASQHHARAAEAEARAVQAEARAIAARSRAADAEARAATAHARAEKAKAKAARAKAKAGFVINGRSWRITAPLRRIYSAFKRPN